MIARAGVLVLSILLCGCEQQMRDMYDQPKLETFESSELFSDGKAARLPVPGTMALETQSEAQPPVTADLIHRGRERYNIYCVPCHGLVGEGEGMVVKRGFPPPPSLHIDRLRDTPDQHIYDVITDGYGVMYSYANRVKPADRWAIIAYIRALQLSQHVAVARLSPADRQALESTP